MPSFVCATLDSPARHVPTTLTSARRRLVLQAPPVCTQPTCGSVCAPADLLALTATKTSMSVLQVPVATVACARTQLMASRVPALPGSRVHIVR